LDAALKAGAALLAGFFFGAIPFGVVFGRLRGVDLQKVGSGNIGATNAARALGRAWGVLVLLCDAAKVALPLLALRHFAAPGCERDVGSAALAFGAVLGHMFSPWLRGRGGKGVATGFGAFLVLAPLAAAIVGALWAALYAVTRVSSVGSLAAITALPILLTVLHAPHADLALSLALYPLIVWKHRDNIRRLLRREEKKV
jgi:glycerol-3-phosphate acyltransferase PlsY